MSHISIINLEITDLDCLKKACLDFNPPLEFVEDQKNFNWYGKFLNDSNPPATLDIKNFGKCDHAIKVPGANYEVGVIQKEANKYELQWDYWGGGGLQKIIGKDGGLLKQNYTKQVVKKAANLKGYSVMESKDAKGKIKLAITIPER